MKRLSKELKRLMMRLVEANLGMEHYWFFPKRAGITVTVQDHKRFSTGRLRG